MYLNLSIFTTSTVRQFRCKEKRPPHPALPRPAVPPPLQTVLHATPPYLSASIGQLSPTLTAGAPFPLKNDPLPPHLPDRQPLIPTHDLTTQEHASEHY